MGLFDRFKKKDDAVCVVAPVAGDALQLKETTEPLFSTEMLGKGIAIKPSGTTVYAPITGKVISLLPHAIGITDAAGVEVLVHIGIETVNMKGEGFTSLVAQGDDVTAGQPVVEFDAQKIADAGCEDTVFVVITNTADLAEVAPAADGPVKVGDAVVTVRK